MNLHCGKLAYGCSTVSLSTHQPCTFVRPSTDQRDCISRPETTSLVLSQLFEPLEIKLYDKIHTPGVGESTIAFKLAKIGF